METIQDAIEQFPVFGFLVLAALAVGFVIVGLS